MSVVLFSLLGILLKTIDEGIDGKKMDMRILSFITGIAIVLWIHLMSLGKYPATILLSVIFGSLLSGKIDNYLFTIASAAVLLATFFLNFQVDIPMLAFLTVAGALDEIMHSKTEIFSIRPAMKVGVAILYLGSALPLIWAIAFFAFDLSYDVVSLLISCRRKRLEACTWR